MRRVSEPSVVVSGRAPTAAMLLAHKRCQLGTAMGFEGVTQKSESLAVPTKQQAREPAVQRVVRAKSNDPPSLRSSLADSVKIPVLEPRAEGAAAVQRVLRKGMAVHAPVASPPGNKPPLSRAACWTDQNTPSANEPSQPMLSHVKRVDGRSTPKTSPHKSNPAKVHVPRLNVLLAQSERAKELEADVCDQQSGFRKEDGPADSAGDETLRTVLKHKDEEIDKLNQTTSALMAQLQLMERLVDAKSDQAKDLEALVEQQRRVLGGVVLPHNSSIAVTNLEFSADVEESADKLAAASESVAARYDNVIDTTSLECKVATQDNGKPLSAMSGSPVRTPTRGRSSSLRSPNAWQASKWASDDEYNAGGRWCVPVEVGAGSMHDSGRCPPAAPPAWAEVSAASPVCKPPGSSERPLPKWALSPRDAGDERSPQAAGPAGWGAPSLAHPRAQDADRNLTPRAAHPVKKTLYDTDDEDDCTPGNNKARVADEPDYGEERASPGRPLWAITPRDLEADVFHREAGAGAGGGKPPPSPAAHGDRAQRDAWACKAAPTVLRAREERLHKPRKPTLQESLGISSRQQQQQRPIVRSQTGPLSSPNAGYHTPPASPGQALRRASTMHGGSASRGVGRADSAQAPVPPQSVGRQGQAPAKEARRRADSASLLTLTSADRINRVYGGGRRDAGRARAAASAKADSASLHESAASSLVAKQQEPAQVQTEGTAMAQEKAQQGTHEHAAANSKKHLSQAQQVVIQRQSKPSEDKERAHQAAVKELVAKLNGETPVPKARPVSQERKEASFSNNQAAALGEAKSSTQSPTLSGNSSTNSDSAAFEAFMDPFAGVYSMFSGISEMFTFGCPLMPREDDPAQRGSQTCRTTRCLPKSPERRESVSRGGSSSARKGKHQDPGDITNRMSSRMSGSLSSAGYIPREFQ
mmetsp:Transcript_35337/g.67573  ORF Transcript_35337/g.67573 Transcript_35337/m.67573 type:complete len:928 (-) Transcript_35337:180-2963(-)|eukprot:CAMPEP_0114258818 /NCGR_PEP_ID=MMETSP0058-20121206/19547_1 /TAXON_ID=36894 /ORGANISM="Pyramimonas parkeae, CCMP726" /LENGTH=927 /DNA_ID=CAMNT_0001373793 /DNA_START=269 /DNA_END=3052 /DNA_ORIENTATION=+